VVILSVALLASVVGLLVRVLEYRSAADEYTEIAERMAATDGASKIPEDTPAIQSTPVSSAISPGPVQTPSVLFNAKIASLRAQNSDTVGFLEVGGTVIQYPVLQGEDNLYYENHTFKKQKNASGAIFLDSQNAADLSDFNLILYGHNMKDGSMFHELLQYRKAVYAGKHREIKLTGLYEDRVFYVFSAYACSQDTDVRGFKYNTVKGRQIFLNEIMGRSVISAGTAKPSGNEQIITLVTCRENTEKDYFVVHGVLVE
jgi:sortase B